VLNKTLERRRVGLTSGTGYEHIVSSEACPFVVRRSNDTVIEIIDTKLGGIDKNEFPQVWLGDRGGNRTSTTFDFVSVQQEQPRGKADVRTGLSRVEMVSREFHD